MDIKQIRERHDRLQNTNNQLEKISGIQDELTSELKDMNRLHGKMVNILQNKVELLEQINQIEKTQIRKVILDHRNGDGTTETNVIDVIYKLVS